MQDQNTDENVYGKLKEVLQTNKGSSMMQQINQGHIHRSYRFDLERGSYFVQQINDLVFPDVYPLMAQMQKVTATLSDYYGEGHYETLDLLLTNDGVPFLEWQGQYWRIFRFKDHLKGFERLLSRQMLRSAAKAYASFVGGLTNLDLQSAFEPIMQFHDISYRLMQLQDAKWKNPELATTLSLEIMAIDELIVIISPLTVALQSGELPVRMVHNDTKINNLLFDESQEARCVVDLDTVMPGSVVYDVGDALRTICSNLPEDAPLVDQLIIDEEAADIFIDAYQIEAGWLEEGERKWLRLSPVYMSLIMGVRFLTDYFQGDVYFHTARTGHNLDRARNQIKLAQLFADRT
ncbi:MAG: hypothetical protein ACI8QD_001770 [Cyclobacteriaceae bacterium]|jgi:hypothetical protein